MENRSSFWDSPIISICHNPNGFLVPQIASNALSGKDLHGFGANTHFLGGVSSPGQTGKIQHNNTIIYPEIPTNQNHINHQINQYAYLLYNQLYPTVKTLKETSTDRREDATEGSIADTSDNINPSYITSGISKINKNKIPSYASKFLEFISTISKEEINNLFVKSFNNLNTCISTQPSRRFKVECWRTKPSYNWSKSYKVKADERFYKTLCNMDYKNNLMVHMILKVDTNLYSHDEAISNITSSLTHLKRTLKDNKLSILKSAGIVEFHLKDNDRFEYPHVHLFLEFERTSNIDIQKRLIRKIVRKSWRLRDTKRDKIDIGEVKFISTLAHYENACTYCIFSPNIKGSKYKKQSELPHRYDHHTSIQRCYISLKKKPVESSVDTVESAGNVPSDKKPIDDIFDNVPGESAGNVPAAGNKPSIDTSSNIPVPSIKSKSKKTIGEKRSIVGTSFRITDLKRKKPNGRKNVKGFHIDIPFEEVKKISNKGYNEDKALVTYLNDKSLKKFIDWILLYRVCKKTLPEGISEGNLNVN